MYKVKVGGVTCIHRHAGVLEAHKCGEAYARTAYDVVDETGKRVGLGGPIRAFPVGYFPRR